MRAIIAIDPGITGALAFVTEKSLYRVRDMPTALTANGKSIVDEYRLLEMVRQYEALGARHAILERAQAAPGQSAPAMFNYGTTYGLIRMALTASGVSYDEVSPMTWKRWAKLAGGRENKDASRRLAASLFPDKAHEFLRAKDHGRAEASIIGRWWFETKGT
jgi:hypothetical protein